MDSKVLSEALQATAKKRTTERYLTEAEEIFVEVQEDMNMQKLWIEFERVITTRDTGTFGCLF